MSFLWAKNGRIERPMSFLKESEVGSVKGEGEMKKIIKRFILVLFVKFFEKEIDDLEPEGQKSIAKILKPYIK